MIPIKAFGNTKHESTRTIFGAFALSSVNQEKANEIMDTVATYGVNHIDTAASYGNSEQRLGPWLKHNRSTVFLATKTEKRTYLEAKEELHKSLDLLKTDSIDLWQMHNLVNEQQWKTALNENGAIEAFLEAKQQGLVRYIGVTGHGLAAPKMHFKSINQYNFDSVLLPYNFSLMQNCTYASSFKLLLEECMKKNIAVQTIKSLAIGKLGDKAAQHNVWYQPLSDKESIDLSVRWVLGNPNVFLNTSGDFELLKMILQAADNLGSEPSQSEMHNLVKKHGIEPLFTTDEI